MREDLDEQGCLADAAAVLAARRRMDLLLLRLAMAPFDVAAIDDLRRWIDEDYPLAAPAWIRLHDLPDSDVGTLVDGGSGDLGLRDHLESEARRAGLWLVGIGGVPGRRHDDPPLVEA